MSQILAITGKREPLTTKQQAFAEAYVANGGNGKQAAIAAGYSENSARMEAHRLLKHSKVLAEIVYLSTARLASLAPKAIDQVENLITSARSDRVKLDASIDLLNRLGLKAPDKVDHRVAGDISLTVDLGG